MELVAVVAGSTSEASAAPSLASAAVPIPSLVPVLEEAGSLCPGISAPLLAAQIKAYQTRRAARSTLSDRQLERARGAKSKRNKRRRRGK